MMTATMVDRAAGSGVTNVRDNVRTLYEGLYQFEPEAGICHASRAYLDDCLEQANELPCELPSDWNDLERWAEQRHERVGQQYLDYLKQRESGAPRRYFSSLSHALYFLQGVSPTKFVDGTWLYGLLPQWWDDRYHGLIRIYLEELGEGSATDNHVAMYRRLLAANGCEHVKPLNDDHYIQGAIQLSLARNTDQFLPEVVGFNLGYEQLPLHLLITAHELKELGIDPYYFQVHVTVDNAGTGHARKALEAVRTLASMGGEAPDYYARVRSGYCLNDLGVGTVSVIASFDLDAEVVRILAEKSVHGRHMHSNYCKVAGRNINDWLSDSSQIPQFLKELEANGWIRRGSDPVQSRFWRLIEGECAEMFGVFSRYERQVIHDWISADGRAGLRPATAAGRTDGTAESGRSRKLMRTALGLCEATIPLETPGDFGAEMRRFENLVTQASGKREVMEKLAGMMGPAVHHTPMGMLATRIFSRLLDTT